MIATESPAPTPALLESHWASSATRDAAASYERVSTTELGLLAPVLLPPPPPPLLPATQRQAAPLCLRPRADRGS